MGIHHLVLLCAQEAAATTVASLSFHKNDSFLNRSGLADAYSCRDLNVEASENAITQVTHDRNVNPDYAMSECAGEEGKTKQPATGGKASLITDGVSYTALSLRGQAQALPEQDEEVEVVMFGITNLMLQNKADGMGSVGQRDMGTLEATESCPPRLEAEAQLAYDRKEHNSQSVSEDSAKVIRGMARGGEGDVEASGDMRTFATTIAPALEPEL